MEQTKTKENLNKLKIVFVGIPDMATVCLNELVKKKFNITGVVPPKKTHEAYGYFSNYIKYLNLNLIDYSGSPNDEECINKVKELNADIGVICSYNYRLKKEFINIRAIIKVII